MTDRFPELGRVSSIVEQDQICAAAKRRFWSQGIFAWKYAIAFILIVLIVSGIAAWMASVFGDWGVSAFILLSIVYGAFDSRIYEYFLTRPLRRFVRLEMLDRGYAICVECGYDLRGQQDPRCPECGTHFAGTLGPDPSPARNSAKCETSDSTTPPPA